MLSSESIARRCSEFCSSPIALQYRLITRRVSATCAHLAASAEWKGEHERYWWPLVSDLCHQLRFARVISSKYQDSSFKPPHPVIQTLSYCRKDCIHEEREVVCRRDFKTSGRTRSVTKASTSYGRASRVTTIGYYRPDRAGMESSVVLLKNTGLRNVSQTQQVKS